jgi:hypothetical protein
MSKLSASMNNICQCKRKTQFDELSLMTKKSYEFYFSLLPSHAMLLRFLSIKTFFFLCISIRVVYDTVGHLKQNYLTHWINYALARNMKLKFMQLIDKNYF